MNFVVDNLHFFNVWLLAVDDRRSVRSGLLTSTTKRHAKRDKHMDPEILRRVAAADAAAIAQRARMPAIQPRQIAGRYSARVVWLAAFLLFISSCVTQIGDAHGVSTATILFAGLAIIFYLLPSFVAYKRGRTNKSPILLLNLLLGWTFIGWVIALVWSTTTPTAPRTVQSNRMGLGELAVRTAVRATVWETVFSVFRLMR